MSTGTSTARDAILGRLSSALGAAGRDARVAAIDAWAGRGDRAPRPERAAMPEADRVRQFAAESRRNGAVVIEIGSLDALPSALAGYMREHNLDGRVRIAAHPGLAAVDWSAEAMLEAETGRADPSDAISVAMAAAGAAETGSVLFVSGPESPATLHVLPLHHVSVVDAATIAPGYEDAVARIRAQAPEMPRVLNIITGPSRTADIEQTLLMGAHGPQSEVVVIVGARDQGGGS